MPDAKHIQAIIIPSNPPKQNNQSNTQSNLQNQTQPQNTIFIPGWPSHPPNQSQEEYTFLAKPIEVVFKNIVQANIVVYPLTSPFDM